MKKIVCIVMLFFVFSQFYYCFAGTTDAPWVGPLENFLNALMGPTAKVLGGIAIVVCGVLIAFMGMQAAPKFLWIIGGLGVAVNALGILDVFVGFSSGFIF